MSMRNQLAAGVAAVLLAFGTIYGLSGVNVVEPGEFAVVIKQFGEDKGVLEDGLSVGTHWIDPVIYDVENYDTKAVKYSLEMQASTKDGQPVSVHANLEISLEHSKVRTLHAKIGRDYFEQVVLPAANSAVRGALPTQLSDTVYQDSGRLIIQTAIEEALAQKQVGSRGIIVAVNLQEIRFLNAGYLEILERKAGAAQLEEIERREAAAAEQRATKTEHTARGEKLARIQAAEAGREESRLKGEGVRLQKEEEAKGILAVGEAESEVIRMKAEALIGSGGQLYRDIEVLGGLGEHVEFYGVPTGAAGTSTYIIDEALRGQIAVGN